MGRKRAIARSFALYVLIGCVAAGVDAALFILAVKLFGTDIFITNIFTVAIGSTISFILNRHYNFKVKDHPVKRGLIFFGVCLLGMLLSQGILWAGRMAGFDPAIVKLVSTPIVGIFQFVLNRTIAFREQR